MKLHHIGIVCKDIQKEKERLKNFHQINHETEIVHDELQNADLCMLNVDDNVNLELIAGPVVEKFIAKGIQYAHLCWEVDDIEQAIAQNKEKGALLVSEPKPAVLFDMKKVAFMYFPYGLVELIEVKNK